ncbi:MAG: ABC transporter substrate-binding protein [Treponema sp.]|nr:ABC transporter substrate-binding protein [Treponema sp.]
MNKARTSSTVVVALLIAILSFSCEKKSEAIAVTTGTQNKLKIALVQLSQNPSFTDMQEGFIAGMEELGYGSDKVEYLQYDAGGSISTLHHILNSLESQKVDLLVPLVTSVTQAAVSKELDIPIIFISVTDPVEAGIMASLQTPDKNATGTCNVVPMEELFVLAKELTPHIRSVGIIYDPSLPNSVITVNRAKQYLGTAGFVVAEAIVTNSSEVQSAARTLATVADAIYVPIDSTILSAISQVVDIALEKGKPVYGSAPSMVTSGALASVSVSEWETGRQTAALAHQYFEGTPIEQIPAKIVDNFLYTVNGDTAKALNITIPAHSDAPVQLVDVSAGARP